MSSAAVVLSALRVDKYLQLVSLLEISKRPNTYHVMGKFSRGQADNIFLIFLENIIS